MHVRRAEREQEETVDAAHTTQRDGFASFHKLTNLDEGTAEMIARRHDPVAVIDEDLESAAIEFARDAKHLAGCRSDDRRARTYREVGAIVAVVRALFAAEISRSRYPDGPPELRRRLLVAVEVANCDLAPARIATEP